VASAGYVEPNGAWRWGNGEVLDFSAWAAGEPNDADCLAGGGFGPANYLQIVKDTWGAHFWNDIGETGMTCYGNLAPSFVIEWSADCNDDGIVDYGQILTGQLADSDANGVPDICERPTDVNRDGVVNGGDLALLLDNWGGTGTGDVDGDGTVGGGDLTLVLNDWG
jgi:hypothetical protein